MAINTCLSTNESKKNKQEAEQKQTEREDFDVCQL